MALLFFTILEIKTFSSSDKSLLGVYILEVGNSYRKDLTFENNLRKKIAEWNDNMNKENYCFL